MSNIFYNLTWWSSVFRTVDFRKNVPRRNWSRTSWVTQWRTKVATHQDWLEQWTRAFSWMTELHAYLPEIFTFLQFGLESQQKDASSVGASNTMVQKISSTSFDSFHVLYLLCRIIRRTKFTWTLSNASVLESTRKWVTRDEIDRCFIGLS